MSKVTVSSVGSLIDATTAANTINSNFTTVATAFDNTLSLDGTSPNSMLNSLDMNSNQILNLPSPATANSPLRLQDLNTFIGGGTIASIPAGGTTGQALVKTSNVNFATGWSNSVTSVGLSLPSDFTITNSPVTTTGTLTGSWAIAPTGTGAVVRATSPTLVTPVLGVAAATTINKVTLTAPATAATLTIANNKTLTANNSLTFAGTDATTITFQATDTYVGRATTDTLTNKTLTSPVMTSPTTGVPGSVLGTLTMAGSSSGSVQLQAQAAASGFLTMPSVTDTLIGKATTDTLTNKTYDTAGAGNVFKVNTNAISAVTGTGSSVVLAAGPTITGTATFTGLVDASGASAGQIKFPATQNASANANTLDDYAEGTWTPVVSFGGASVGITYGTQQGKYTKIGNVVHYVMEVILTSKGSSVGALSIAGLPVTSAAFNSAAAVQVNNMNAATISTVQAQQAQSSTTISMSRYAAGANTSLADTDFTNTSVVRISGIYFV